MEKEGKWAPGHSGISIAGSGRKIHKEDQERAARERRGIIKSGEGRAE